jgi:hypothetical protein
VRGTLSIAKAVSLLDYAPAFPIEAGFARYIGWYRELTDGLPVPTAR